MSDPSKNPLSGPLWYKDAVFYELYIRAFADGNGDGKGDFAGLTAHLDYLQELGVDCIWLQPMYQSPLLDDGYDIADFYVVHPDFGTLADFQSFVEAVHARGMRVIVDLVLNHTSDQHPWFQASRRREEPYTDFYVWSQTGREYGGARIIFLDTEPSNWTFDPLRGEYYWHRFFSHQPDLNYDNPLVQDEMLRVMCYWMDMGIDGFRADAVPYLFEREGTNCENLAETHAFLKRLRAVFDERGVGKILLAEANQWPEDVRAYFGGDEKDPNVPGDEFNMGFHFPVMPRLFMALRQADVSPIVEILQRTPAIPANCQWCTFLRNHDELTLEMVTEEERQFMWREYAPEPRMRLNLGIRRRLAPLLDNDRRKIEVMDSLLFTLPGSPIIYYGDEIGMGDNIWLPDRNGVRTPMQWDDGPDAGFSTAPADQLYAPIISDPAYDPACVNVAAARADPTSLYHMLRRFIAVRKQHPVFGRGGLRILRAAPRDVLAFTRSYGGETLLALHNLGDCPETFALDLVAYAEAAPVDLLTGEALPKVTADPYRLTLPPYGYRWLGMSD
jgi:maltose alpha-D-glucosyltransferase / alpha-amylase